MIIIVENASPGGSHGAMVIAVGSGYGDSSSNLGQDCIHFTLCQYSWERCEFTPFQLWVRSKIYGAL